MTVCWVSSATWMQAHALEHTHTQTQKNVCAYTCGGFISLFSTTTTVLWIYLSIVLYTHCLSGFHSDMIHNFVWVGTPNPIIWYKVISVPEEDTGVVFSWLCQCGVTVLLKQYATTRFCGIIMQGDKMQVLSELKGHKLVRVLYGTIVLGMTFFVFACD